MNETPKNLRPTAPAADALLWCGVALIAISLALPCVNSPPSPGIVCLVLSALSIPFLPSWLLDGSAVAVMMLCGLWSNFLTTAVIALRMLAGARYAAGLRWCLAVGLGGCVFGLMLAASMIPNSGPPRLSGVRYGYFVWVVGLCLVAVSELCRRVCEATFDRTPSRSTPWQ